MSSSLTDSQDQQIVSVPDFQPSPKQARFLSSDAYETFFAGSAGPGKTAALCAEAVTACLERENTRVYIFRKTIPELKQSIVPEIRKQCALYLPQMPYNSQDRRFVFANGSSIQLAYCDNPGDYYRYQSAEIHELLFDELTHFTFDEYEYLKTRVRSVEPRILRVMAASNPGNVGHGWVKSYFIDVAPPGEIYTDPVTNQTRLFLPAVIDDHPIAAFREQYRKTLQAIVDPDLRKALLEGDWNLFAGQVYSEWRRQKHVIDSIPIDLSLCDKYIGFDWGYSDSGSAHWIAVAPENQWGVKHYYVYREIYENKHRPEEWAHMIGSIIKHEPVEFLAMPHDTFDNLGGTRPIVEQFDEVFQRENIDVTMIKSAPRSHTSKINRQALMHDMLADSLDGKPVMQVLSTCINLIRTLPMMPYSATRVEEIDDKAEDHAYDSVSYGVYAIANNSDGDIAWMKPPEPDTVESPYIGTGQGMITGTNIDIGRILNEQNNTRDWRNS